MDAQMQERRVRTVNTEVVIEASPTGYGLASVRFAYGDSAEVTPHQLHRLAAQLKEAAKELDQ